MIQRLGNQQTQYNKKGIQNKNTDPSFGMHIDPESVRGASRVLSEKLDQDFARRQGLGPNTFMPLRSRAHALMIKAFEVIQRHPSEKVAFVEVVVAERHVAVPNPKSELPSVPTVSLIVKDADGKILAQPALNLKALADTTPPKRLRDRIFGQHLPAFLDGPRQQSRADFHENAFFEAQLKRGPKEVESFSVVVQGETMTQQNKRFANRTASFLQSQET